jgi:hypothetical protein
VIRRPAKSFGVLVLAATGVCLLPLDARAYVDPGSGSFLLQMVIAAVLGGLITLRGYWSRIKEFLTRRRKKV